MYLIKKLYSLFQTCCTTTNEPPSPLPYRRKLPNTKSTYKTICFDKKYKGIVL